ncbi:HNH endonuclease [Marinomonas phage P12026]|uniref:HNH endonuclease n=1 Tax=Marinomonas phage P12026 TaxID=1176423 RepID=UPI0002688F55|nr:HNH endonuclease [Marinomonas phage P12026]AFM54889.1 hypothetical protein P12026_43 [Marinomonas phage P12026]
MKENKITVKKIKEVLRLDNGVFYWNFRPAEDFVNKSRFLGWNKIYPNTVAGSVDKASGYRTITITIKGLSYRFREHRLAWAFYYGELPKMDIDHIDHNKTNNKRENLRLVTPLENNRNVKLRVDNKSGVCGVSFSKLRNKWVAQIRVFGKNKNLGWFSNIEEAKIARARAEKEYNFHENHGLKL